MLIVYYNGLLVDFKALKSADADPADMLILPSLGIGMGMMLVIKEDKRRMRADTLGIGQIESKETCTSEA